MCAEVLMMFEDWHKHARLRAAALGLTYEALSRAHDAVLGAMGTAWVEEQDARRSRPQSTMAQAHPLFVTLRSPTDQSVIEVAELAMYLVEFGDDTRCSQLLDRLRAATEYGPTLFELAMAYRWKTAGATVTLEPETPRGRRADFDATIGSRFVVECSAFPNYLFATEKIAFTQFLTGKLPSYDISATLVVEVDRVLEGDFYGAVGASVHEVIRQFEQGNEDARRSTEFGSVRFFRTSRQKVDPEEYNIAVRLTRQPKNSDGSVYGVHLQPNGTERGWVLVRYPDDAQDPYIALTRKFKVECEQLAGVTDPRVILLDAAKFGGNVHSLDKGKLNGSIVKALVGRPKVAAVWVMSRIWTSELRYQYRAIMIQNPESPAALPVEFYDTIADREHRHDFLTGKTLVFEIASG